MRHVRRDSRSAFSTMRFAVGALSATSFAILVGSVGCGADNGVVGGDCAAGYTQCGLVCVDISNDPENCGGCGNVCASGICTDGKCESGAARDAGADASKDGGKQKGRDGGSGDGPHSDATDHADGHGQDGAGQDGTLDGAGDSQGGDGSPSDGAGEDGCSPPYDNNGNCGSCGFACDPIDNCVAGDGGAFQCVLACTPPEKDCSGICVDESDDPNNCGACGKFCPSGICTGGICDGSTEGDIVIIGHDYNSSLSMLTAPKLLTNAVFLPTTEPVRVLSFEHYADATSVSNVKSVLDGEASLTGRKIAYTVSMTDTDIPVELSTASFDVLFVYDQTSAAPGVLGPLGASWASTLATFTSGGGIVVSLDGAAGTTQEMPQFDTSAGLLAVTGHTVIAKGTPLDVVAPGDAIGHGVFSPYAAEPSSVFFLTTEANGGEVTYVVVDPSGPDSAPVVVHKAVP
jgi:hypothetical protein